MFQPFQKYLEKAAKRHGIVTELNAAKICHSFRVLIPEIFQNPEAQKNIKPGYFKDGTIIINVESPAWGQEVIMRKEKIIDRLNKKAGKQVIKKLHTQIRSF